MTALNSSCIRQKESDSETCFNPWC